MEGRRKHITNLRNAIKFKFLYCETYFHLYYGLRYLRTIIKEFKLG